jgi:hypothetical protein
MLKKFIELPLVLRVVLALVSIFILYSNAIGKLLGSFDFLSDMANSFPVINVLMFLIGTLLFFSALLFFFLPIMVLASIVMNFYKRFTDANTFESSVEGIKYVTIANLIFSFVSLQLLGLPMLLLYGPGMEIGKNLQILRLSAGPEMMAYGLILTIFHFFVFFIATVLFMPLVATKSLPIKISSVLVTSILLGNMLYLVLGYFRIIF